MVTRVITIVGTGAADDVDTGINVVRRSPGSYASE